ncbi:hypothetical protein KR038_010638, partial [Drosophila bunnanda]
QTSHEFTMLTKVMDFFNRSPADPVSFPLAGSNKPVLTILAVYLLFVKVLGPRLMANRKAFDLRGLIRAYNILQILYNVAMFTFATHFIFGSGNYNFRCIVNLPLDHEYKTLERWLTYSYFFNKLIDLIETVFFVLRKKDRQISFLHVFHHCCMSYLSFAYMYYNGYGGQALFMCYFNVIIHILMYTYYYQSQAANEAGRKDVLWWKKYITLAQLIQFGIIVSHSIYTLSQPDCPSARFSATAAGSVATIFLILFSNFYVHAYILPKKKE